MSCSMTIDAVRARTKTVTRRHIDTWRNLRAGDRLTLIEKGMGLAKGERQVVLAEVEIVERLTAAARDDPEGRRARARGPRCHDRRRVRQDVGPVARVRTRHRWPPAPGTPNTTDRVALSRRGERPCLRPAQVSQLNGAHGTANAAAPLIETGHPQAGQRTLTDEACPLHSLTSNHPLLGARRG